MKLKIKYSHRGINRNTIGQ